MQNVMIELHEKLKVFSEKYKLNYKYFKVIEKKSIFKKKIIIFYGINDYFFELNNKNYLKSKNYFPFFDNNQSSTLESWICSIKSTMQKKNILLKSIDDGKDLRNEFKNKHKV